MKYRIFLLINSFIFTFFSISFASIAQTDDIWAKGEIQLVSDPQLYSPCEKYLYWDKPRIPSAYKTIVEGKDCIIFEFRLKVTEAKKGGPTGTPLNSIKIHFVVDITDESNNTYKYVCNDKQKTESKPGWKCEVEFPGANGEIEVGSWYRYSLPILAEWIPPGNAIILANIWKLGEVGNQKALESGQCNFYKFTGSADGCKDVSFGTKKLSGTGSIKLKTPPPGGEKEIELEILFPTKKIPFAFTSIAGGGCGWGDWLKGAYPFWVVEKGTENTVSGVTVTAKDSGGGEVGVRKWGDGFVFYCDALEAVFKNKRNDNKFNFIVEAKKEGYVSTSATIGFDWKLKYTEPTTCPATTAEKKVEARGTECPTDYNYRCNPDNKAQIQICDNGKWTLAYTCPVTGSTATICDETKTTGTSYGCKEPEKKQEVVSVANPCKKSDGTIIKPDSISVAQSALGTEQGCKCYECYWNTKVTSTKDDGTPTCTVHYDAQKDGKC